MRHNQTQYNTTRHDCRWNMILSKLKTVRSNWFMIKLERWISNIIFSESVVECINVCEEEDNPICIATQLNSTLGLLLAPNIMQCCEVCMMISVWIGLCRTWTRPETMEPELNQLTLLLLTHSKTLNLYAEQCRCCWSCRCWSCRYLLSNNKLTTNELRNKKESVAPKWLSQCYCWLAN